MKTRFVTITASLLTLPLAFGLTACGDNSALATAKNDTEACKAVATAVANATGGDKEMRDAKTQITFFESLSKDMKTLSANKKITEDLRKTAGELSPNMEKVAKMIKDGKLNLQDKAPDPSKMDMEAVGALMQTGMGMQQLDQICRKNNVNIGKESAVSK